MNTVIDWKTEFDICAVIVMLAFIAVYYSRKRFPSLTGKLFAFMIWDLLVCSVIEYAEAVLEHKYMIAPEWLLVVMQSIYMVMIAVLCFVFSIYVFLVARKGQYTNKVWYWYVGYLPGLLLLLLVITSPFTKLVFYFENGLSVDGPLRDLYYGIILLYLIFACGAVFVFRKNILKRDRVTLYLFVFLVILGMAYEFMYPGGLIINFLASIALILLYLLQQGGQDRIDTGTKIYNRSALLMYCTDIVNVKEKFSLVSLMPNEIFEVINGRGTFYADAVIRQFVDRLRVHFGTKDTYTLGGGRFVVIYHGNVEPDRIESEIKKLYETPFKIREEQLNISPTGCILTFPGDFESADEAVRLCEHGLDIAHQGNTKRFVTMRNFDEVRDSIVAGLKKEQLKLEEQKADAERAKEAAEAADKAKSTFLAHMSHEIRTPLTTIIGMTEILLRAQLSDYVRDNIESIYTAGHSLLQIINDILDFSKIEAGKFEIIEEPYNTATTMDAVVNVLKVRCESKPVDIVVNIDESMPSVLIGDETRVRQVLYNIISNAAKYTDKGRITFSVQWDKETQELTMRVSDTGRGIRKEDMERLFESFRRIDEHINRNIEGTGLGLSITKRIVELMGGHLEVSSVFGEGSTFGVVLKQGVEDATPISESHNNGTAQRLSVADMQYFTAPEARVLVVDDNAFNRKIAQELIVPHRILIDTAGSGIECIEKVKSNSYDMIFLDHMMPGMDGIETLKRLNEDEAFAAKKIPVIAFTANAVSGMKETFRNAGFSDFLSKPINVAQLESMLVNFLPSGLLKFVSKEEFDRQSGNKGDSSDFSFEGISIPYTDIEKGLENMGRNTIRYIKLLKVILADRDRMRAELAVAYDRRDFENYTIYIHALKSNMASIGAAETSELAKQLENAGRSGDEVLVDRLHMVFLKQYGEICDGIAKACQAFDEYALKPAGNREALTALRENLPDYSDCLTCIRMLIDECEYDTAMKLSSLFVQLAGEDTEKESFREISDKLEMYDYDGATAIIDKKVK